MLRLARPRASYADPVLKALESEGWPGEFISEIAVIIVTRRGLVISVTKDGD
jgi:hypothetical protein